MDERSRPGTAADLGELVRLATAAAEAIVGQRGGWMHLQLTDRQPPLEESFAADLLDTDTLVAVGTIGDVIVGYGVVRRQELHDGDSLASVTDLFVEPDGRGVSVGEFIMDDLVAWATAHGCIGIDAVALPGDRETKNFFERFGLTARAIQVHRRLGERETVTP